MADERSLKDWFAYIHQLHCKRIDLGLERIAQVAKTLQLQGFSCPVITVAGTNGKGSTIATLESIYSAAGFRVAVYTSPHLIQFNERIRFNGEMISDRVCCSIFSEIEKMRGDTVLSFFEFTTLAALYYFKQQRPDVILLEVGLGGRLDAVNIIDPDVSVITSISLDHCDWLGDDRETIGREKAGIMRANKPVVIADNNPPQSLFAVAEEKQAQPYVIHRDFTYEMQHQTWAWQTEGTVFSELPVPQLKIENVAAAIATVNLLMQKLPVKLGTIQSGISNTAITGRFQHITTPYDCVFDVAHNAASAQWLSEQLQQLPKAQKTLAIFSVLSDKDVPALVQALDNHIDEWMVPQLDYPRAADKDEIAADLKRHSQKNCYTFDSVQAAYNAVSAQYQAGDRIVVFGSFHTVGDVLNLIL